jgi:glutathione S-transferase
MNQRTLIIYGFETSNNIKVRLALEHKGIPYEFRTIEATDRDELVRVSGQFLTPAMVDGDVVLFDSGAILRYLDANYPETPKLFGHSHSEQWEIEDWERFGRGPLAEPMMSLVHARVRGEGVTPALEESAAADFGVAIRKLEGRLDGRQWLVGDEMTAADITCAAVIYRIRSSGVLPWPTGVPRTEDLAHRLMALLG